MGRTEQRLGAERTRTAPAAAIWRWSSDDIPPRERVSQWHDVHAKAIARRTITTDTPDFGRVDVELVRLGAGLHQVGLQRMTITDASAATRDRMLLQDGNDDVILHLQLAGTRAVRQLCREAEAPAGGAIYSVNGEPSVIRLTERADFVSIALPRAALLPRVPRIEDAAARSIAPDHPPLRLLVAYLRAIDLKAAASDPRLGTLIAGQILDLAAHIAGDARPALDGQHGGIAASRLAAIKAMIGTSLTGEVSVASLARGNGVSTRYVHKLFERDGTTLSRYVLGLRLDRLRRSLADPRNIHRTIADLIYATGFNDISTCNRAFMARYDATPGDIRRGSGHGFGGPGHDAD